MEDIQIVLKENYPNVSLMFMDDNASKLIFRIRINFETHKADDDILFIEEKIKEINEINIKGVDGITFVEIPTDEQFITNYCK